MSPPGACCGLTLISTGQLDAAKRRLRRTVEMLAPYAEAQTPIVGLEPSCAATLRSDLLELLPGDERAATVAGAIKTLAEVVLTSFRTSGTPDLAGRLAGSRFIVQPHCHHRAILGFESDIELLKIAGADIEIVGGCCGLAGNFGMEKGHYEVSVKVAESSLLPQLTAAAGDVKLLADGFSCRTQAEQLVGWRGWHMAEILSLSTRAEENARSFSP